LTKSEGRVQKQRKEQTQELKAQHHAQTTIENKGERISAKSIEFQDKEDTLIQYNHLEKSSRVASHKILTNKRRKLKKILRS
jgi:hypothetical protein